VTGGRQKKDRWNYRLLTIKEVRQIELDVIVAEVSPSLREIGFDFS
jgi:hypothetical protein